jgi:Protein of unknown function (DUF4240)
MNEQKFWEIIAASKKSEHDSQQAQEASLTKILSTLDTEEVISFDKIFTELILKSYTWDLWGAAYIIDGGCSDDGFEYFRRGLIASGRARFEAAMHDAESLADWAESDEMEFEGISYVASATLKERGGAGLPNHGFKRPSQPAGEPWDEEGDDLEERFPKLWAKFNE